MPTATKTMEVHCPVPGCAAALSILVGEGAKFDSMMGDELRRSYVRRHMRDRHGRTVEPGSAPLRAGVYTPEGT